MEASEYPYLSWYLVLYVVINLQNDIRNVSFIGMIYKHNRKWEWGIV